MLLSLVLPAYNEERRIGPMLEQAVGYRNRCVHDLEVIVVDDGSTDNVVEVAQSYTERLPELRVVSHDTNMGKGRAVATGMLEAKGDYRAFFDADGATPVSELDHLLDVAKSGPRVVAIGSVRAPGSVVTHRQSLARVGAGRAGNLLIRAIALPGVRDSQRGCKLFPGFLADVVFAAQKTDGWGFDIEILALCQKLRFDVVEVPVRWNHIEGGQIGLGAYFSTLAEAVRIRRLLRRDGDKLVEQYATATAVGHA